MDINNEPIVVLGVDFGATSLKALVVDQEGTAHKEYVEESKIHDGPHETMQRIINLIERAGTDSAATGFHLTAVGIGVCGPLDYQSGELIESPVLPGWKRVPVASTIRSATGLTVHVENDANLAILGEWWRGVGRSSNVVAGLTLGTGIGGGLVVEGRVYRGAFGFAGEFGHIQVAEGPDCLCGGRGCLGRVASATATMHRYQEHAQKQNHPVKSIVELGVLARQGDCAAQAAIKASADYLATASLTIINFLNPKVFLLTGGMSLLGELLLLPIRERVTSSTFANVAQNTRIEIGQLGTYSGCYGAARLAMSDCCSLPES